MMIAETLEIIKSVPVPVWLFVSLICFSAQLGSVTGVHDFTVYRMQHLDFYGTPLGCRSAVVNMEARSSSSSMLNRKCVILQWSNLTLEVFNDLVSRGVGAMLLLLPSDWKNADQATINRWIHLENSLLWQEVTIPVYFAFESEHLTEMCTKLAISDESMPATAALISFIIGEGYMMLADATDAVPIENLEILTIVGKLLGQGYDAELPTVVLLTHYDSFGLAPGLSRSGDSGGSGVAAILELARVFYKLYSNPVHRPKYNLLFVLTGGGKLNYFGTKNFIEDMLEDTDSFLLMDADYILCLDALSGGSELFVHVSRPPKDNTKSFNILEQLNVSSSLMDGFSKVTLNHKKIRIGDELLAWEHERFSLRRIPAATLSHFQYHNDLRRKSMFHMSVNLDVLYHNVQVIVEGISRHFYGINGNSTFTLPKEMNVHKDHLREWLHRLSATSRSSQNLYKDHPLLSSIGQTLSQYVHEVSTFAHKPDISDPEFVLYSPSETLMHSYSVKPAIFDLILALCIAIYVIGIYLLITYMSVLQDSIIHLIKKRVKGD